MLIAINSGYNRVNSVIRRHIDNYRPTAFTSSDVSTGTIVPVLDAEFHEAVALWPSYEYAIENGLPNSQLLLQEFQFVEKELARFYGLRAYKAFTITIAAPGVITEDAHGLIRNDRVSLITTGALPTGLSVDTFYYVVYVDTNTFKLSATRDGSAITTTGSQSGTHYYYTPDMVGRIKTNGDSNK